jgi:hypothetical protein
MGDQSLLGAAHWGNAVAFYQQTRNVQINSLSRQIGDGMSPHEAVFRVKPDFRKFTYAFGTPVTCHKVKPTTFLEAPNDTGVYVGHAGGLVEGNLLLLPAAA